MRTRKIIAGCLWIGLTIGFYYFAVFLYESYLTNEYVKIFCNFLYYLAFAIVATFLINFIATGLSFLLQGEFDQWFETHTDPIIKKVQDFFNRRNKVL